MACVAAGVAGLTVILSPYAWTVHDTEPANESSAGTQSDSPPTAAALSFDERFSSGRSAPPFGSVPVKTVIAALPATAMIAVPAAPAPNVAVPPPGPALPATAMIAVPAAPAPNVTAPPPP